MRNRIWTAVAVLSLPFAAAVSPVAAQEAGPTITIAKNTYDPAELAATAGQEITVVNQDGFPHTVTSVSKAFDVDVPPKGTVTFKVDAPGSYPYTCTYHPGQHNAAKIEVS
jgi:plastocyanin